MVYNNQDFLATRFKLKIRSVQLSVSLVILNILIHDANLKPKPLTSYVPDGTFHIFTKARTNNNRVWKKSVN